MTAKYPEETEETTFAGPGAVDGAAVEEYEDVELVTADDEADDAPVEEESDAEENGEHADIQECVGTDGIIQHDDAALDTPMDVDANRLTGAKTRKVAARGGSVITVDDEDATSDAEATQGTFLIASATVTRG